MGYMTIDGKRITNEEYQEYREKKLAEERAKEQERRLQVFRGTTAGKLLKQLGEAFVAYREIVEQDPEVAELALEVDEINHKIFERMKSRIERAQRAPRCQRQKSNGEWCRAPRVRGKRYCHMHMALEEALPKKLGMPTLEDANGIQVAIQKGAQGLLDGTLERKDAGLLAYYLQLAVSNVNRVKFEP